MSEREEVTHEAEAYRNISLGLLIATFALGATALIGYVMGGIEMVGFTACAIVPALAMCMVLFRAAARRREKHAG